MTSHPTGTMPSRAQRAERRRGAVVYHIYPRSFADSNGDGIGDIPGIEARLDHIAALGVDAIRLSPVFASPQADHGYDVSDHRTIDPRYGTVEDMDRLVESAHARGLEVILDMGLCHTSIEHPWFREHPDWYVRSEGEERPNNWRAVFGGPAWSRDEEREEWYLHNFFPEQPALDWRNPEVVEAMHGVIRFWLARGVDGFRLDAVHHLFTDPELRDEPPAARRSMLPFGDDYGGLDHEHTTNLPAVHRELATLRAAFPDAFLVCDPYCEHEELAPYLASADLSLSFELLFAPRSVPRLREVVASGAAVDGIAWMLGNHDFPRLMTSWGGVEHARVAALLLLTLPGATVIYQGDEIGMIDGPGSDPPHDRAGRDPHRHPMQWTRHGGFTTGTPWQTMANPAERNVAEQNGDPRSMLTLYRDLITLRRTLGGAFTLLDSPADVLAYRRGPHQVWINLGTTAVPIPRGDIVLATAPVWSGTVVPGSGVLISDRPPRS